MKAKQFAWTHVITHGKMNMRPSYYGGWEHIEKHPARGLDARQLRQKHEAENKQFLDDLKKYGVDWVKTDDIQSETYSKFLGTFCDAADYSYIQGWITLNNGTKAFWCSENIDASDVFGQMEKMTELIDKYTEIFGE